MNLPSGICERRLSRVDVMGLYLAILLAIDNDLIILGMICICFGHEPHSFCILALGGRQNVGKVTSVGSAFLFA